MNPFKANHTGRSSTLSKSLLSAGLLGAAISALSAGSANAADSSRRCTFGSYSDLNPTCAVEWSSPTASWELGDKKLTEFSQIAGASGLFSFLWNDLGPVGIDPTDNYNVLVDFLPSISPPSTGSYSYVLAITPAGTAAGYTFKDAELDANHSGSGQVVTKEVTGLSPMVSTDGVPVGPVKFPGGLTSIAVKDSWNLDPAKGRISSINNVFTQEVPGPLPLLGAGVAFGFSRRIRSRIKGARLARG